MQKISALLLAAVLGLPACGGRDFTVTAEDASPESPESDAEAPTEDTLFATTKDAEPEAEVKPLCTTDLSYLGRADDFTIAFTITTVADKPSPLLNQRPTCSALQPFWDLQMLANGALDLQIGGSGDNVEAKSSASIPINDGAPHKILVHRNGSLLSFTVDGKDAGKSAFSAATGKLPPLKTGETDKEACPMEPLAGKIIEVCLLKS